MSFINACANLASFKFSEGACRPSNTTQRSLLPFVHEGDCRPCETTQRSLPPLSDHAVFHSTVCMSVAPSAGLGACRLGPASSTDNDLASFPLSEGACRPSDTTQTSLLQFPDEGDCRPCQTTERSLPPFSHEGACRPSASTRGACRPRDAQTDAYSVQVTEPAARAKIGERACRLAQTNTTTKREGACRPLRILAPLGARRPGFQAPSHIISTPQSKHHGRAHESSKLRAKRTHHAGTRVRQLSPGPLQ